MAIAYVEILNIGLKVILYGLDIAIVRAVANDDDVYRLLEVKAVVRLTHNESKPQKSYY